MSHRVPEDRLLDFRTHARSGPGHRARLTPAQVQQIARTVAGTPEVMLKVLRAGAPTIAAVRRHLDYVGREGDVALHTDDGQVLRGDDAVAGLALDWDLDLEDCRRRPDLGPSAGRPPPRLVHKLVFSMPAGTAPDKVLTAVQGFCREEFGLKHRYLAALHTDEPHPHVHVLVKAMSEQRGRLHIRKATLRGWQEEFARQLRAVGVAANATPRSVRGETKPRKSDGIYRAARRGESTHMRERVLAAATALCRADRPPDPSKTRLEQTREAVARGWRAIIEALGNQGHADLAGRARKFVGGLPPARTEREWLMAGLADQRRRQPAREMDRSR